MGVKLLPCNVLIALQLGFNTNFVWAGEWYACMSFYFSYCFKKIIIFYLSVFLFL